MDMRSGKSCAPTVLATGDEALQVNSAGKGPVSAEWMIPKALWLKRNEPDVYAAAKYICEYQDCMNYWLTGEMVASVTNVTIRWHYSATHGWPISLLESLHMSDLLTKWPQKIIKLGEVVGVLTQNSADYLGLPVGMTVAQGGADAFIGIIGLGVVNAGELALLTGSSHLHLGMCDKFVNGTGVWGAYEDAVLPGAFVVSSVHISVAFHQFFLSLVSYTM
jgi:ribulose kinase